MVGVLHQHPELGYGKMLLYHRRDGAIRLHNVNHSRHIQALDRKHKQNGHKPKNRPPNRGSPMAGDGNPVHTGKKGHMKPREIRGGGKRPN